MPTERFIRLPQEKKDLIWEAAAKEFMRVPFERASINQIIHNAGISRGSFYTYFEDKADVVNYLMEAMCEDIRDFCEQELARNGGDYFSLLGGLFDHLVDNLRENKGLMEMVRNVFSYQDNVKVLNMPDWSVPGRELSEDSPVQWLFRKLDLKKLRFKQPGDLMALVPLGMAALMMAVRQYYEYPEQLEVIRSRFYQGIEILKWGAMERTKGE